MIEIQEGWTADQASMKHTIAAIDYDVLALNTQLAELILQKTRLQVECKHVHVVFSGQHMACDVCGMELHD